MSQEQPPIRSRRELRQARDERAEANQESGNAGPGAVPAAAAKPAATPADAKPAATPADTKPADAKPADVAPVAVPPAAKPADAAPAAVPLAAKPADAAPAAVPPAAKPAEVAPAAAKPAAKPAEVAPAAVPPAAKPADAAPAAAKPAAKPAEVAPAAVPPAAKPADAAPAAAKPASEPAAAEVTGRIRRVAAGPVDSVRSTSAERSSQVRARDRAALRTIKELAEKEGHLAQGGAPTRRQLRLLQLAAETAPATSANLIVPAAPRTRATPVVAPATASGTAGETPAAPAATAAPGQKTGVSGQVPGEAAPGGTRRPGGAAPEAITVEQALAARELLARQAHNQIAKMEHIAATDPEAVNQEVLAEQIALAERAAVLNRRAAAKQKLAEQNSQPVPARSDPSTASNLAMVTPLEFVEVPGVERPVMKRPATSYVPVVTNPGPRVEDPRKSAPRRPGFTLQRGSGPETGRAGVLARAEAAARAGSGFSASPGGAAGGAAGPEDQSGGPAPVPAKAAYGLDPLDVATAGLGRAQRLRMIQLAVLALGVLAFITGITLILASLGR